MTQHVHHTAAIEGFSGQFSTINGYMGCLQPCFPSFPILSSLFFPFFFYLFIEKNVISNVKKKKNESHQIINIGVAQASFNVVFFVVVMVFLGNNIDFWLFHNNSIFPLPLLIVFISPSHLPHKSLLTGGTSWLFESPQTKRKAAIKSWGNRHILCQTFSCNKRKKKLRETEIYGKQKIHNKKIL